MTCDHIKCFTIVWLVQIGQINALKMENKFNELKKVKFERLGNLCTGEIVN